MIHCIRIASILLLVIAHVHPRATASVGSVTGSICQLGCDWNYDSCMEIAQVSLSNGYNHCGTTHGVLGPGQCEEAGSPVETSRCYDCYSIVSQNYADGWWECSDEQHDCFFDCHLEWTCGGSN